MFNVYTFPVRKRSEREREKPHTLGGARTLRPAQWTQARARCAFPLGSTPRSVQEKEKEEGKKWKLVSKLQPTAHNVQHQLTNRQRWLVDRPRKSAYGTKLLTANQSGGHFPSPKVCFSFVLRQLYPPSILTKIVNSTSGHQQVRRFSGISVFGTY